MLLLGRGACRNARVVVISFRVRWLTSVFMSPNDKLHLVNVDSDKNSLYGFLFSACFLTFHVKWLERLSKQLCTLVRVICRYLLANFYKQVKDNAQRVPLPLNARVAKEKSS